MKNALLIAFLLLLSVHVNGQNEQNIWTFGNRGGLDFTTASPIPYSNNLVPGIEGSACICDNTGQLLFYSNGFWIWNRYHQIMPELTGGVPGYTAPASPIGDPPLMHWNGSAATQGAAITSFPAHPGLYYLFTLSGNGQLFYTLVDMSLNSGLGGIVAGKKSVPVAHNLMGKLTVVNGCNNIWVIVRSKNNNEYRSFEVNDTGIVTVPVISSCGNLPLTWYKGGAIKCSPDRTKMAVACHTGTNIKSGGLELYDFNAYTGVLSNAVVLDSSSNTGYYYGACFSPDNTKLYASVSSSGYANVLYWGRVRQFNVSLSTPAAIIASNTIVFTDYSNDLDRLGDLKRGKNNKIYFTSGKSTTGIHVINSPNATGVACNAVSNVITLLTGDAERGVPNDVAILPAPDTVRNSIHLTACFSDTLLLQADTGKNYHWNDNTTGRRKIVTHSGTYVATFINSDCKFEIDSFYVHFVKLPVLGSSSYSCPGANMGSAWIRPFNDSTFFTYSWYNSNNVLLRQHATIFADTLTSIDTGSYSLRIETSSGCDTTIYFTIMALPVPVASFYADSLVCKGVPLSFSNTSAAPIWKWYFGDGNFSNQQNPNYSYGRIGDFTASLIVTNIEGCSDTAYRDITVKTLELELRADKSLGNRGDLVHLQSSGSETYSIASWQPAFLFVDQSAKGQTVSLDTTRLFVVTGVSEYGCVAKASVEVAVNPMVFMPTCFTPNGDGLNDRFRPVSTGYIFVRYFEIYNRYGQQVYQGIGKSALDGWDGTFNGQPCELGTYYYHINVETKEANTVKLKGDVTLLR